MSDQIIEISLDLIDDPKLAVRSNVNDEGIDELATSIKTVGLISPLVVQKVGERYEIIAGHRRVTAMRRIGIAKASAIVRDMSENEATVLKLHENLLRQDVNPVDEAIFLSRILKKNNITINQAAIMTHRSPTYIRDRLDILEYPDYLIEAVGEKQIGLAAAGWLNKITDENVRRNYISYAVRGGITVKRALAWFDSWQAGREFSNPTQIEVIDKDTGDKVIRHQEDCLICRTADVPTNLTLFYAHWECAEKLKS